MINNDVLRRIRYTFDYSDSQMADIFSLVEVKISREQICTWLKSDEDPDWEKCEDSFLANFLNGLIIKKRGRKEGELPRQEKSINNNDIFRKLKIAFELKADEILQILELADFKISKHELSALFRKPDNRHYRECNNQFLRNFLKGLQLKYRDNS
ncbi:UNVERIFIED_CONTAM: hypothetical protein GTU68_013319 [Idotea baltica]|nr:hypothetical protein [Idotea baltica]